MHVERCGVRTSERLLWRGEVFSSLSVHVRELFLLLERTGSQDSAYVVKRFFQQGEGKNVVQKNVGRISWLPGKIEK